MSIKQHLAILFGSISLPMDEYKELPAFKSMELEEKIVGEIQEYHLPEITKLICGSSILIEFPWADKYRKICPYCNDIDLLEPSKLIASYSDANKFENEILIYKYQPILEKLQAYIDELQKVKKKYQNEKANLQKKIKAIEKKESDLKKEEPVKKNIEVKTNTTNIDEKQKLIEEEKTEEKFAEERKRIAEINEWLEKIKKYSNQYKKHFEKIEEYLEKCKDKITENRVREKVYGVVDEMKSPEEEVFIREYIKTGELSLKMEQDLKQKNFCDKLLQIFEKSEYKNFAFPILVRLYENNAIDLEDDEFMCFIKNHPVLLGDYLAEIYNEDLNILENVEKAFLLELAIKLESKNKNKSLLTVLWNSILKENDWIWIYNKIFEQKPQNINFAISKFISGITGKAAMAATQCLYNISNEEVSIIDVCSYLLEQNLIENQECVIDMMQLMEQTSRNLKRKFNIAERRMNSQTQDLFSSIYIPVEQLEELAVDLKGSDGNINCSLVGKKLMEIIIELREGLETMNVVSVAEFDDWKYQHRIEFDPKIHKMTINSQDVDKTVTLRTMGFLYQDDEGEWKQFAAKVCPEQETVKIIKKEEEDHLNKNNDRNGKKKQEKKKNNKMKDTQKNEALKKKHRKGRT